MYTSLPQVPSSIILNLIVITSQRFTHYNCYPNTSRHTNHRHSIITHSKKISLTSSSTLDTTSLIITHQKKFLSPSSTLDTIHHRSSIIDHHHPTSNTIDFHALSMDPKKPPKPLLSTPTPIPPPPSISGTPGDFLHPPNCTELHPELHPQTPSFHHHSITIIHSSSIIIQSPSYTHHHHSITSTSLP